MPVKNGAKEKVLAAYEDGGEDRAKAVAKKLKVPAKRVERWLRKAQQQSAAQSYKPDIEAWEAKVFRQATHFLVRHGKKWPRYQTLAKAVARAKKVGTDWIFAVNSSGQWAIMFPERWDQYVTEEKSKRG